MRTGTIIIGGKFYPVRGLSVRQSLNEDSKALANKDQFSESRMRRIAMALQNADAYLPDPKNPNGQFRVADLSLEQVVEILNDDIFDSMEEWYDAEKVMRELHAKKKDDAPKTDDLAKIDEAAVPEGESQATTLESGTSPAPVA